MSGRAVVVVLDSLGVGGAPDALKYNETLANNNNIEIKKIENLLQNKLIRSQRIIKEINKNNFICPYV